MGSGSAGTHPRLGGHRRPDRRHVGAGSLRRHLPPARRRHAATHSRRPLVARRRSLSRWVFVLMVAWHHGGMPKNLTVRLDDDLAAETEALARAEGQSLNETVKLAL